MGLGDALRALLDGAAIDGESVAPRASLVGQGVGPAPFKVQQFLVPMPFLSSRSYIFEYSGEPIPRPPCTLGHPVPKTVLLHTYTPTPPPPHLQLAASAALQPLGGGPIHDAVRAGDKAEVTRLLDSGTDINSKDEVSLMNHWDRSWIHRICR